MKKRTFGLLAAAALMLPLTANASYIFFDDFEGTGATDSILNWNGGDNWWILSGSVDLVESGDYGITCSGDTGFCVDMDGSTYNGGDLVSINLGPLGAGTYTLSYDLSGNQRSQGWTDSIIAFVEFAGYNWTTSLSYNEGWQTFSRTFTLNEDADNLYLRFSASGGDNVGMMLDNVKLVPEPGTLALLGLGLAGLGMSRRRKKI